MAKQIKSLTQNQIPTTTKPESQKKTHSHHSNKTQRTHIRKSKSTHPTHPRQKKSSKSSPRSIHPPWKERVRKQKRKPTQVPWCEEGLLREQDRETPYGAVMWGGVTGGTKSRSPIQCHERCSGGGGLGETLKHMWRWWPTRCWRRWRRSWQWTASELMLLKGCWLRNKLGIVGDRCVMFFTIGFYLTRVFHQDKNKRELKVF